MEMIKHERISEETFPYNSVQFNGICGLMQRRNFNTGVGCITSVSSAHLLGHVRHSDTDTSKT